FRWVRFLGEATAEPGTTPEVIHGVVQDVSARRLAQEETMRLAMRLTTTLASISEAFATLDREGRFTYVNRESERLLGRSGGELLEQPIHEKVVGRNPTVLRQEIARALAEDRRVEVEDYYPSLDKWLELRAYPYAEGLAVYMRDVTRRRESQERLMLLRTSIACINDSVVIIQAAGTDVNTGSEGARIIFVNESFERLTGLSHRDVGGRSLRVLRNSIGAKAFRGLIRNASDARGDHLLRHELLLPRPDGGVCWMDLDVVAVHDPQGSLVHWVAVGRDVTERKLAEQKINRLAFFDTLTLLPNRQLLIERLNSALERVTRVPESGALMFIDLDDFKILNDTRGHSQGDLLLQQVALRLTGCLRKGDTVARIGGDEFVVLLQDLGWDPVVAESEAHTVASKLLARLAEPFDLGQHLHHCTISIGVTCFDARHGGVDELLKQADVAMYHAKGMGGNTFAFFDPIMQATLNANAALSADLRVALQNFEQLVVQYQPICDAARNTIGVEALLRWHHPVRGLCNPIEFIPLAENNGLIVPLGLWVLQQACAQLAIWGRRPETAHLSIAVNVSVGQFRHPDFVAQVVQAISTHDVQPRLLKLELTESLLADRQNITLARMDALKRLGVAFSLDDFGTGYSSLSYLKRLPLDQLKIDKGFVADILTDPSDAAIARAVIELAHSLSLPVIAEGVETEEQYQFLVRCGCDLFQGFLIAHPMEVDALEDFLSQQARAPSIVGR
ncbi:MAG: bifunctional diguanylate cyclase/phosphodiesterase, partial [Comamonadaceae bacterium]